MSKLSAKQQAWLANQRPAARRAVDDALAKARGHTRRREPSADVWRDVDSLLADIRGHTPDDDD
ncbi:MAG: hypothetical protein KGK07_16205, partial [Chloroflexota bacterium]|nr:hypothetical protein [Chloroflexota bacterium]